MDNVRYELTKTWLATQLRGFANDVQDVDPEHAERLHSLADCIISDRATTEQWQDAFDIIGTF